MVSILFSREKRSIMVAKKLCHFFTDQKEYPGILSFDNRMQFAKKIIILTKLSFGRYPNCDGSLKNWWFDLCVLQFHGLHRKNISEVIQYHHLKDIQMENSVGKKLGACGMAFQNPKSSLFSKLNVCCFLKRALKWIELIKHKNEMIYFWKRGIWKLGMIRSKKCEIAVKENGMKID